MLVAVGLTLISAFTGWRAVTGDSKQAFVWKIATPNIRLDEMIFFQFKLKQRKKILLYTVGSLVCALLTIFFINAFYTPPKVKSYSWNSLSEVSKDELEIITWNIGYGGLGKESNFILDGGTDWLPESKLIVKKNVSGIVNFIKSQTPDVFFFQEIAKASLINRRVSVFNSVVDTIKQYQNIYVSDFCTHLIPPPISINFGLGVFARTGLMCNSESRLLPLEPRRIGAFRKNYQMVVNQVSTTVENKKWILINLHLAAFDSNADIRAKQLEAVRSFAMKQYQRGNFVVIGGDWNLRLAKTEFPHQTEDKYLFWVHDLPDDAFPSDWKIVADPNVPSVRTVHQAYIPGDNYVTIIDGFITSPNVEVVAVETINLNFAHSDHHPVKAHFRTINKTN
ncbi:MAG: hypothetical protein F6J94_06990 [Moorea sp. SIO1F2]|uniref:endonuclease/exonuclease/phosphatase family protein n=2 Tax=unclassified Moorena TaxID=2683338 RepID=UPI0013B767FC|nr:endonuclease/exonuclease/phosphatase family protein [Moorena sp. SIO1F2]NET81709.1 hypothetical protein [Moorena sp. SIO1F2]